MRDHVDELISIDLYQTRKSLDIFMGVYKDFMLQLYTDDETVELLKELNSGGDRAFIVNRIRRRLNGIVSTRPEILCVTLITPQREVITYDRITGSTAQNPWLKNEKVPEIYNMISPENQTILLNRFDKLQFGKNLYNLIHLAHRIIDYRRIHTDIGIIIISLDERFISDLYTENELSPKLKRIVNFLHDDSLKIVSFPDKQYIGRSLDSSIPLTQAYAGIIRESGIMDGTETAVQSINDEETGWTIVSAADLSFLYASIESRQQISIAIALSTTIILFFIIILISKSLTSNISKIVDSMVEAGKGNLRVKINASGGIPTELRPIADEFNEMMGRIQTLIDEVKSASHKQKEAELRFLESQINPHFLYNILDSINWMAIEHEEYEISNMLSSLASIFRYSIDDSMSIVSVGEDIKWLREYIRLQEIRCKYAFTAEIEIEKGVEERRIHKMLIQPFVENAIIHGFSDIDHRGSLRTTISESGEFLMIDISDNGKGIPEDLEESIGIGIRNAINRVRIYYGEEAGIDLSGNTGGTTVILKLPIVGD